MPDLNSDRIQFSTDTLTHPITTVETDLFEELLFRNYLLVNMDLSNFTGSVIIKVYNKTDAITYRQLISRTFPLEFDSNTDCVDVVLDGRLQDMKITLTTPVAEAAIRNIPVDYQETFR